MSDVLHHAIVVTVQRLSSDALRIATLQSVARGLGLCVTSIESTGLNGYETFVVVPSGSKIEWTEDDRYETARAAFREILRVAPWQVEWVEVLYGRDLRGEERIYDSPLFPRPENK